MENSLAVQITAVICRQNLVHHSLLNHPPALRAQFPYTAVKGQLFCSSDRARVGNKYRFATRINTNFRKMTERNNFKIKEEKAIHRHIHICAHGAEEAHGWQCVTLGQHRGWREKQHKALQKLQDCAECSGGCLAADPKHPRNHSSFPSLKPDWNDSLKKVNYLLRQQHTCQLHEPNQISSRMFNSRTGPYTWRIWERDVHSTAARSIAPVQWLITPPDTNKHQAPAYTKNVVCLINWCQNLKAIKP